MTYFILRQDALPDALSVRATDDLDLIALRNGVPIGELQQPITLELGDQDLGHSDLLESPYFIVSEKMRLALTSFGIDNIDYYETQLADPVTQKAREGFWLGNIIGVVACVDEANSHFKKLSGNRSILRRFAVDEQATKGLPLFRLGESKRLVLINSALKEHLQKSGLEGLYFQEPSEFNGKPASSFW